MGPRTHAAWLGSMVFDGARAFEGVTPDLELHCARVNRSAEIFLLKPLVSRRHLARPRRRRPQAFRPERRTLHPADVLGRERTRRRHPARSGFDALVPVHLRGGAARSRTASRSRSRRIGRPTPDSAPVDAKAAASIPTTHAPSSRRSARGFDNCLMRDMLGNIAELGTANVFMAKDGVVYTPAAERHVPQRHHAPARDQAPARGRRDRHRDRP